MSEYTNLTNRRDRISVKRAARQRGAVMVEAALVTIVFVAMLVAVFDFAQFLFLHQALVERARWAARWALVNDPTDSTSIQNMVIYGQSTAGTNAYFGLSTSNVSVSTAGSGTDDYRLVLSINNYQYPIISPYIAGSFQGPNIMVSMPIGQ